MQQLFYFTFENCMDAEKSEFIEDPGIIMPFQSGSILLNIYLATKSQTSIAFTP